MIRGLSSTIAQDDTLQNQLVAQFERQYPSERMKAFLGQDAPKGTTARAVDENNPSEDRQPPLFRVTSNVTEQMAIALQRWEGMVTTIKEDTFVARLKDLSTDIAEEEVEMTMRDVSDDDKDLVQIGAIFYWSIGYETTATRQVKRTSIIKFRRLPAWSAHELNTIKKRAAEAAMAIGWGAQDAVAKAG